MCDRDDVRRVVKAVKPRYRTLSQLTVRLTLRSRGEKWVGGPGSPRLQLEPLRERMSLENAEIQFFKPRVRDRRLARKGERGGFLGASKRARVQNDLGSGKAPAEGVSLRYPGGGERHVALTLNPPFVIPKGSGVANKGEITHQPRVSVASVVRAFVRLGYKGRVRPSPHPSHNAAEQNIRADRPRRTPLWELPSVLSLDVPLIAVVWQLLLSRSLGATLTWPHSALLGVAVWLIYSADRWLDGLELDQHARTERHRFYVRHRHAALAVWSGVSVGALGGGLSVLTRPELFAAGLLASLMLVYFLGRHTSDPADHPKEAQIGLFFALGVAFLPGLNGAPLLPLATFAILFAVLIFLNCALIARWEGDLDHEPVPFAARTPRVAAWLDGMALGLAGCGLGVGFATHSPLFFALGGSALLLYGCGYLGALGPAARRVLADAALLTPLLALPFS